MDFTVTVNNKKALIVPRLKRGIHVITWTLEGDDYHFGEVSGLPTPPFHIVTPSSKEIIVVNINRDAEGYSAAGDYFYDIPIVPNCTTGADGDRTSAKAVIRNEP